LPIETTSIHKISIQLLTPENLFWSLPACHSARRALRPEVAESTTDANGFCDSVRRLAEWQHGWRCPGYISEWREGWVLPLFKSVALKQKL